MQNAGTPAHPKYRPDIDGLRGIAVLAVVGFHAFPTLIPAGFIGVDVFFVISGFLIASIILRALEQDRFSFIAFYARRVRRIFPALIVVLATVFVAGWFLLSADGYKRAGLHILGGATFSSNVLLWRESGYFDIASDRKVLLHLWSLAIEEQFYLFFPLVLWAAHKRRLRPLAVTSTIGLTSFVWNISVARADSTMSFYAPQTRAWELMAGAMLASASLRPPDWLSWVRSKAERWLALAPFVGAFLLCFGAVLITKEDVFPGWWALLPTLGTALLIFGGAGSWINRHILSNRALVWVGLISFPLYLWHWPLLSFARIVAGGTPSWLIRSGMVITAILLAWLTYAFVEKPARFGKSVRMLTGLLIPLLSLGVIGYSIYRADGFESRPAARTLEMYLTSVKMGAGGCVHIDAEPSFCRLGEYGAPPLAFVYGDSHAGSLRPVLAKIAEENGRTFVFASVSPPLLGITCPTPGKASRDVCGARNRQIFDYVKENGIRNVILIARWTNYSDDHIRSGEAALGAAGKSREGAEISYEALQSGLRQTIETYEKIGVHVYVFSDNPLQRYLPEDTLRKSENTDESINASSVTIAEHVSKQAQMKELLSSAVGNRATLLDFTDVYCRNGLCPLVKDGKFLYADRDHVSIDGSLLIYPELKKALMKGM